MSGARRGVASSSREPGRWSLCCGSRQDLFENVLTSLAVSSLAFDMRKRKPVNPSFRLPCSRTKQLAGSQCPLEAVQKALRVL